MIVLIYPIKCILEHFGETSRLLFLSTEIYVTHVPNIGLHVMFLVDET